MSKYDPLGGPAPRRCASRTVPWDSKPFWAAANFSLQHLCARHQAALGSVRETARQLKSCLESLFPVLDTLCRQSCAACQAPCCHVATVWFDYKDLLFMHLSCQALALEQLSRDSEGICRCCGPSGCRLPRLSRPWTCSWYLCPTQKNLLAGMPRETVLRYETSVAAVKQLRRQLETDFIRITS